MTAFFADSHPGHKRSHNEDCYAAMPHYGLWLVADGVGGHSNGEVAAAIVRDTVAADVAAGEALVEAIRHAHEAILGEIANRPQAQKGNMGSTVVALRISGKHYEVAWVGDSRAYLFDGDNLRPLTRDHNPVSELVARGIITAEQAARHPERNLLSQSLGVSDEIRLSPGQASGELRRGEQILLCSDGLSDELSDQRIRALLREQPTPDAQVRCLIQAALDAGGRDNISVAVVGGKSATWPFRRQRAQASDAASRRRSHLRTAWLIVVAGAALLLLLALALN